MRRIGSALAATPAISCAGASGERQTEQKPASSAAAQRAPRAAAPAPPPQAAKGAAAPMTAADAADKEHQEWVRTHGRSEASRPQGDTPKRPPRASAAAKTADDAP